LANIIAINVQHATLKDVEIQGYKIAKGTVIIPHIGAIMSDPKAKKIFSLFQKKLFRFSLSQKNSNPNDS
jgi:hypothetical protein